MATLVIGLVGLALRRIHTCKMLLAVPDRIPTSRRHHLKELISMSSAMI